MSPITRPSHLTSESVRTFLAFILLTPLLLQSPQAQTSARGTGGVLLNEDVRFYDIVGRSENDLLQAMLGGGPVSNGGRFFGLTSTEVRYTYYKTQTSIGCDLTDVQVHLGIVTTLPRWRPYSGTAFEVERKWRSFERALQIHENGHKQFALEEADMIHRALESLRMTSCDAMDAEARRVATRIRETYVRRHNAYDARTDHGTTQGAVWPLRTAR